MIGKTNGNGPDFGALVFSVDFELHWGVRDICPADGGYRANLLGEREAVPRMLALFDECGVAATWATVGFLFARSRDELTHFSPALKPHYDDPTLSPYREPIGEDEQRDPLHYAPSLIDEIRRRPRQEVGTHTFSHYYCLESGQTEDEFRADLGSAAAIAREYGVRPASIVFPRNQHNPDYARALLDAGITCYRGNEKSWMYRHTVGPAQPARVRAGRLADSYVNLSGHNLTAWDEVVEPSGLANIPSSRFLRPHLPALGRFEKLRLKRVLAAMREAAESRRILHLWTHAHNLGVNMETNFAFLRAVCEEFRRLRQSHGMRSLTMSEAAAAARGKEH
jgi:hypothetical protein